MRYGISISLKEMILGGFSLIKRPRDVISALRPKTLPAAAAPVLAGCALASVHTRINLFTALVTLFCAAALQAGANGINDYLDFLKGHDTADRLGPPRAARSGRLTVPEIQALIAAVFAAAGLSGLYLVWQGGVVILVFGLVSMAAATGYSWFAKPLGFTGGGEAAAFLFFGPLALAGTFFLQTSFLAPEVLLPGISLGLYSTALLTVNNFRDLEEDRKTGKTTLVVRFGPPAARILYGGVLLSPLLGPLPLVFLYGYPPLFLLSTLTLLPGVPAFRFFVTAEPDRKLNRLLFSTSLMMLSHGALYAAAALVQRVIR